MDTLTQNPPERLLVRVQNVFLLFSHAVDDIGRPGVAVGIGDFLGRLGVAGPASSGDVEDNVRLVVGRVLGRGDQALPIVRPVVAAADIRPEEVPRLDAELDVNLAQALGPGFGMALLGANLAPADVCRRADELHELVDLFELQRPGQAQPGLGTQVLGESVVIVHAETTHTALAAGSTGLHI